VGSEGFLQILSPHSYVGSAGFFPKSIVPTVLRCDSVRYSAFQCNVVSWGVNKSVLCCDTVCCSVLQGERKIPISARVSCVVLQRVVV